MADLNTIIQGIAAVLNGVAGIGKVLDYSRYTASEKEKIDTYTDAGILNCWIVTRESTKAYDRGSGPSNVRSQHKIAIHGYRIVTSSADSEQLHQNMVEAVRAALDNNRRLANGAGWLSSPVQVESFGGAMFFNAALCHYAKLAVIAEDVVQGG